MRAEEIHEIVESNGYHLQKRTCDKLAVMHEAFLIAIEEARAKSPVATIDFATIIRIADRLGVKLTYQDVNKRARWPHTLRLTLFGDAVTDRDGPVQLVVERLRVDGGNAAALRALTFARNARVIDCRVCAADIGAQQAAMADLLKPFEVNWLAERGVTVLDATSGYQVDEHPLRNLAEHVEVVARIQPNDRSPRPRRAGAVPGLRQTVAEVVLKSPDGMEEVVGPNARREYVAFAGGRRDVPVLCRPKVPSRPGGFAGAARKERSRVLAEKALWLSQGRYVVDRSVPENFSARENAIALEHLELLIACDKACR
jgi:hypothetical protein